MADSFLAELIKASRRFSTWLFLVLWLVVVMVFLYALPAVLISISLREVPGDPSLALQVPFLLPENSVAFMLRSVFPFLGTAIALILGALSVGSEHGWGTMKMILTQKPSRLGVLSGKLLVLTLFCAVLSASALLAALVCSLVATTTLGGQVEWPPAGDLVGGFGAGLLVLVVWASLGLALASLFRGSTLAVGLGLIYAYPFENALSLALTFTPDTRDLSKFLPGQNTGALASAFGTFDLDPRERFLFDPPLATLVLVIYAAIFLGIAALLWSRRDVT